MAWGLPTWLGGSANPSLPSSTSQAPRSKDGGYVAPDRTSREHCYTSRDIFFECLDKHDILDAIKEDDKARKVCAAEVDAYERDCARSWVGSRLSFFFLEASDGEDAGLDPSHLERFRMDFSRNSVFEGSDG